jgi:hypothetical protein
LFDKCMTHNPPPALQRLQLLRSCQQVSQKCRIADHTGSQHWALAVQQPHGQSALASRLALAGHPAQLAADCFVVLLGLDEPRVKTPPIVY